MGLGSSHCCTELQFWSHSYNSLLIKNILTTSFVYTVDLFSWLLLQRRAEWWPCSSLMEAWKVLLIFCWLYSCLHCSPADLPTALGSADVTLAWADAGQTVTTSPVVGDRNEGKSCNCQWILYVCIRVSWSRWKLALVLSGWCSVTIACHWATSSKEEETFIVLHLFSYSCACSAHVMGLSPPSMLQGLADLCGERELLSELHWPLLFQRTE